MAKKKRLRKEIRVALYVLGALLALTICLVVVLKIAGPSKGMLKGKWYDSRGNYAFTLYDDGTCEISGEYGIGTWNVVNKDTLRLSNYLGETETGKIYSVDSKCLKLGENGESVFYKQ